MNKLLGEHRWLVFLLPMMTYMLVQSLEPKPPRPIAANPAGEQAAPDQPPANSWPTIDYAYYPLAYTLKIVCTLVAIGLVWPGYREFPFRVSLLSIFIGLVGGVVWIGICALDLERTQLPAIGLGWMVDLGERSGFNPLEKLRDQPAWAWGFLAIRFLGLVAVVPLIEEFFLRGFLARYVDSVEWQDHPIGKTTLLAAAIVTAAGVVSHPAEMLAAAVWFSLITLLVYRTRNIWDAVAAHAVTNLFLGIYVVLTGAWHLM